MDTSSNEKGQPGLAKAALFGLCPKCHAPSLFDSRNLLHVRFAGKCGQCGLDYTGFNVGDGPAALLIIPIAALIITLALWLDIAANPPFWLQVVIWVPVTTIITFISIRIIKAGLLIIEYRRDAREAGGKS
ncbi:DUF983 domain-containing protein [Sphingorhabdus arenilitoris]|uniref:DUF983 domain-containing protein n=1 Tax=Sphingorhabdus arenilitoris TaxID=1490041 RepID=A0ABV8RDM8_9SPHN